MARKESWKVHIQREVLENASLSFGARVVYGILLGYQGKDCTEPFPSLKTLAWRAGCGREALQGYIKELKKAGLLKVEHRNQGGKFLSNQYEILAVAIAASSVAGNGSSGQNRSREMPLLSSPI